MILVTVLVIWIVSLCFHEYAHARVAYAGGDTSVVDKGYLTMNPLRYMNPVSSIVIPAVFILMGWFALPGGAVWIETWRLRSRGWQSMVSLAGPLANLAVCVALAIPFMVAQPTESAMWAILGVSAYWQAMALFLNFLPIPGLDGYGVLEPWLPREIREWGTRLKNYGFFIIVILFIASPGFAGGFRRTVTSLVDALGVEERSVVRGFDGMFFWKKG